MSRRNRFWTLGWSFNQDIWLVMIIFVLLIGCKSPSETLIATPQSPFAPLLLKESDFNDDWSWFLDKSLDSFEQPEFGEESNKSVTGGLVGFHEPTNSPITVLQNVRSLDFPVDNQTVLQQELNLEFPGVEQEFSLEVPEVGTSKASRCFQYSVDREVEYSCEVVVSYDCLLVRTSVIKLSSGSSNLVEFEGIVQEILQLVDQKVKQNNTEKCRGQK